MNKILLFLLCFIVSSLTAFAQLVAESQARLSLTCFPTESPRFAPITLGNGSLVSAMRFSGGAFSCVADVGDRKRGWKLKHTVQGRNSEIPDAMFEMEVLGESITGPTPTPSVTAPNKRTLLGLVRSTRTVKITFAPREDLFCEFWGSIAVTYSVFQEAGALVGSWVPGPVSARLHGVWSNQTGGEAGSAVLTLVTGKFERGAWYGSPQAAPLGIVLVNAGPLWAGAPDYFQTFFANGADITFSLWNEVRVWGASRGYTDLPTVDSSNILVVTWYDIFKWCNALSEKQGRSPVYLWRGMVYRTGERNPYVSPNADGESLPKIDPTIVTPAPNSQPPDFLEDSMVEVVEGTLASAPGGNATTVKTFRIAKTELTYGDWEIVRDWALSQGYPDLAGKGFANGKDYPVAEVTWHDVVKWCNAASERAGRVPVYSVGGSVYRTGNSIPTSDPTANGYRLPTEAEWEFAARGGNKSKKFVYSGGPSASLVGWFKGNSKGAAQPVARKIANELNIFDMSGNVSEFCSNLVDSSINLVKQAKYRGGHWESGENDLKVGTTYPFGLPVEFSNKNHGFRVCRN